MKTGAMSSWIRKQGERVWDIVLTTIVLAIAGGAIALFREPIARFLTDRWTASAALLLAVGIVLFWAGWSLSRRAALGHQPPWKRYREDTILDIRWAWSWPSLFSLDTADVSDVRDIAQRLTPICPKCGGVLYNPALDRPRGYVAYTREDVPHVRENEVKCITCRFEHAFAGPYETVVLTVAGRVVRQARERWGRRRA